MKAVRRKSIAAKPNKGYKVLLFVPNSCICDSKQEKCVVVFNCTIPANVEFLVKFVCIQKSTFVKAERINDTTIIFNTPSNFPPGEANVTIYHGVNQHLLCECTETFSFQPKLEVVSSLLLSVTDPISFIASAYKLNGNDGVAIDFMLERSLKLNCPKDFLKLQENISMQTNNAVGNSHLSNPTLLHFAARFNFIRLCVALLNCPGASTALDITNNHGETPIHLAENCGNKELAQIMGDAKNNNVTAVQQENCADEIYEHMSGEIYDRYKEMKNNFDEIYESMANDLSDTYEHMSAYRRESSNSRASIAMDRQSVYSSDSAISSGSTDSKGSTASQNNPCKTPPPIPPPSYKRSSKPTIANPILTELRKKTEERRQSMSFESYEPRVESMEHISPLNARRYEDVQLTNEDVYDTPSNISPVPSARKSSRNLEELNELYDTPPPRTSSLNQDNDELYDTPTRPEETYDVPPPVVLNHSRQSSLNDEVYDSPTCRVKKTPAYPTDVYDALPIRHQRVSSNNLEEVYDAPPIRHQRVSSNDLEEVYDSPPIRQSRVPSNDIEEVYDSPPIRHQRVSSNDLEEVYDSPPIRHPRVPSNDQQEVPVAPIFKRSISSNSESNIIKPRTPRLSTESYQDVLPRGMSHSKSAENLDLSDEVYDTVPPLNRPAMSPSAHSSPPISFPSFNEPSAGGFQRQRKRFSEPILSLTQADQQRLSSINPANRPGMLPPPILPPRNTASPKVAPPPIPPPRRQQRPSC